jgi:hypothetical protein
VIPDSKCKLEAIADIVDLAFVKTDRTVRRLSARERTIRGSYQRQPSNWSSDARSPAGNARVGRLVKRSPRVEGRIRKMPSHGRNIAPYCEPSNDDPRNLNDESKV